MGENPLVLTPSHTSASGRLPQRSLGKVLPDLKLGFYVPACQLTVPQTMYVPMDKELIWGWDYGAKSLFGYPKNIPLRHLGTLLKKLGQVPAQPNAWLLIASLVPDTHPSKPAC